MPNHITNRLSVEGGSASVAAFFSQIGGDEGIIDFNQIIPMPPSLNIESGSRSTRGLQLYKEYCELQEAIAGMGSLLGISPETSKAAVLLRKYEEVQEEDPELWELGKQCYENLRDYGAATWYEWATRTWGTKWNAFGQERLNESTIQFQTAWSGIPTLIGTLSAQYPELRFTYAYADEDFGNNIGEFEFENGEAVYSYCPDNGSPDAFKLARQLLGPVSRMEDLEMEEMQ